MRMPVVTAVLADRTGGSTAQHAMRECGQQTGAEAGPKLAKITQRANSVCTTTERNVLFCRIQLTSSFFRSMQYHIVMPQAGRKDSSVR